MKNELIICIVNTGFTDVVMEAAKEAGARGGTVLHGRGTANKEAEEFFHISVQADKEMVMILVPSEIKEKVLHAVYQNAGLKTAGQGIAFSLPVTNVVGISSFASQEPSQEQSKEQPEQPAEPPKPSDTDATTPDAKDSDK